MIREIGERIEVGAPFDTACRLAGIRRSTGQYYLAWAREVLAKAAVAPAFSVGEGIELRPARPRPKGISDEMLLEFLDTVEKARATDESRRIAQISQAAKGGAVLSLQIIEKLDKDGNVVERHIREQYAGSEWRANAFLLERRDPQRWGRQMTVDPKTDQPAVGQPAQPALPSVIIYLPQNGREGPPGPPVITGSPKTVLPPAKPTQGGRPEDVGIHLPPSGTMTKSQFPVEAARLATRS